MSGLHLFNAFGVELEYMIVDADSLEVKPISDLVIADEAGSLQGDVSRGDVTWSNELVLHLLELKSSRPTRDLRTLQRSLHANVLRVNSLLKKYNGVLMPTAMHPFMNPKSQMRLWPHDYSAVYKAYDSLFGCNGHGWANVQSTHLNLPFSGDAEFAALHRAIRLLLPILPALCASSPLVDCRLTGPLDNRLEYYKTNQVAVPSFAANIIPEEVTSKIEYNSLVYDPIRADIKKFALEDTLDPIWVNSRGAIARFDRGSIEIRLMDVQECPVADVAIVVLVVETLKYMVQDLEGRAVNISTVELRAILDSCIAEGGNARIEDEGYLQVFGVERSLTAKELWSFLLDRADDGGAITAQWPAIQHIIAHGNLAERITSRLRNDVTKDRIVEVYKELCSCLTNNKMFTP